MCTVVRSLLLGYSSCFYFTYVGYLNFVCGGTGVVSVLNTELHCSFSFCNKNKTFKKKKSYSVKDLPVLLSLFVCAVSCCL